MMSPRRSDLPGRRGPARGGLEGDPRKAHTHAVPEIHQKHPHGKTGPVGFPKWGTSAGVPACKRRVGPGEAAGEGEGGAVKLVKAGSHRLFEQDQETTKTVSGMLLDLEKRGTVRTAWNMGLLSAEELARIEAVKGIKAETPSGRRDTAIVALVYCGGFRRQEIAGLQVVNVNDTGEEMEITIKSGKERKDRVLFLNNGGADALKDYLSVRGASPGSLFWASLKSGKLLENSKMTDQAIYARIKRCAEVAWVKTLSPHDTRRSFVSDMLDGGVDIGTVAAMAGQSSVSTTQRYDRRGDEARKKAAKALHLPHSKSASDY